MIKIIKQEIKISLELKSKVEWICKLNSTKLIFINGSLLKLEPTNIIYIESHTNIIYIESHTNIEYIEPNKVIINNNIYYLKYTNLFDIYYLKYTNLFAIYYLKYTNLFAIEILRLKTINY